MLKKLSIKTQILGIQIGINIIVVVFAIMFVLYWQKNMISKLEAQSFNILINKQIEHHIVSVQNKLSVKLQQLKMNSAYALRNTQDLYDYSQKHSFNFQQLNTLCHDTWIMDVFCYGVQGTDNGMYYDLQDLTNILNQAMLMMSTDKLYYSSTGEDSYFAIWPQYGLRGYQPKQRPWYTYQMEYKNESYLLGKPYLTYGGGVLVTQTLKLMQNNFIRGIIGQDIDVNQVQLQQNYINASLVDQDGKLIISQYYTDLTQVFQYIYNESLTGINETQFQYILDFFNKNQTQDDNCEFDYKYTICIKKSDNTTMLIRVKKVFDFILLFQIDQSLFINQIQELVRTSQVEEDQLILLIILFSMVFIVISIVAYFFTNVFLSKPISSLRLLINPHLTLMEKAKKVFKRIEGVDLNSNNQITKLELSLFNILSKQKDKHRQNPQKFMIEKFKYPILDQLHLPTFQNNLATIEKELIGISWKQLASWLRQSRITLTRIIILEKQ